MTGTAGGFAAAAGHTGHSVHWADPAVGLAVFASGVCFLGAGLYLDGREDVARVYSDLGVGIGILAVLAAVALVLV
jgi:hypothetical protein